MSQMDVTVWYVELAMTQPRRLNLHLRASNRCKMKMHLAKILEEYGMEI